MYALFLSKKLWIDETTPANQNTRVHGFITSPLWFPFSFGSSGFI